MDVKLQVFEVKISVYYQSAVRIKLYNDANQSCKDALITHTAMAADSYNEDT